MNVIETHRLTKEYGRRRVVDRLDMRVARGDIYGFVGRNGAGKSTTMKMIAGLVTPSSGEISLFGGVSGAADGPTGTPGPAGTPAPAIASASAPAAVRRAPATARIGTLIEAPGVLPYLSAFDNLMTKAIALGVVNPKAECANLLELVGLDQAGRKKAKGFSLGMKQRLGLALALVASPDLLLLDEPFNGLDPEGTRAMRATLTRLNEVRGVTIVVSSHVLDQLNRVATRFGVIADGRLVKEMTKAELNEACSDAICVRTTDPARTLALLQDALPAVRMRVEPDHAITIAGASDALAAEVSQVLHASDQTVLELSIARRDVEDYLVQIMGRSGDADGNDAPARAHEGGAR